MEILKKNIDQVIPTLYKAGRMKYMKHMRCSVHLAASYVIGRRGMGFSEKVPAYLKEVIPDNKKNTAITGKSIPI